MTNTRLLTVKLTINQHEKIKKNAESKGMNMSEYTRHLIFGDVNLEEVNFGYKILDTHDKIIKIYKLLEEGKNGKKKSKRNL